MTTTRRGLGAAAVAATLALPASPPRAEQTRMAASTPSDMLRGEAEGIAVTSRGRVFVAPRISPIRRDASAVFPSQVLSGVADGSGNVFLGTGPDGQVVKVTPGGEVAVFFRVDEPLVTSVLVLKSGEILAAAAPGGKIYRIRPDGKGSLWCETGERYVWALAATSDGSILATTGERGRLLKIDRSGHSSVLFDGDETHLVSLALANDGGVWVGGSGRGLVYRIDKEGHGLVVYDDDLPEAKAIVAESSGTVIVAFDAPPASEKRPPAFRLRVAGGTGGPNEAMNDLDTRQPPAMQGVIEGLASAGEADTTMLRGKVVRLTPDGAALELWRSPGDAAFAVALDGSDRPVFATGEPAKLWRVEGADEIALLATLNEAQVTALVPAGRAIVVATSNPAATYRLDRDPAESGTFLAPPVDAGSVARWGTLSWQALGSGGRVELFTRTGNCEDPDGTWSAWSPAQVEGSGSPVASPEGRFLQWRARIAGTAGEGPRIASVTASYATRNRRPSIRDLRVEPASGAVAGKATIRWSAADPDGDGMTVDVQARRARTHEWRSAVRTDPPAPKPSDPGLGNDGSAKDGKVTWDTADWDEGVYEIRAVVTDQPSNPPAEGLDAEADLAAPLRLDRTAPVIEAKRSGLGFEVVVTDALSPVVRLDVIADGRVMSAPRCGDGVCDGTRETFRFPATHLGASGPWSLRATDAAGNAAETPVPSP